MHRYGRLADEEDVMGQAKQRGSRDERIAQAALKAETVSSTPEHGSSEVGGMSSKREPEDTVYDMTSITSTLLAGKEVAEFDNEITGKFGLEEGSMDAVRDQRMQVGIRNSKGEIYRAIGVTGLGEFLSVVQYLAEIGLVDELKDATGFRGRYDAIFSA